MTTHEACQTVGKGCTGGWKGESFGYPGLGADSKWRLWGSIVWLQKWCAGR